MVMFALLLLGPTGSALAGGQAVLADAQDNGRVDECYTRAEFRDALRMARNDQRLYSAVIDTIEEAKITNVAVDGAALRERAGGAGIRGRRRCRRRDGDLAGSAGGRRPRGCRRGGLGALR